MKRDEKGVLLAGEMDSLGDKSFCSGFGTLAGGIIENSNRRWERRWEEALDIELEKNPAYMEQCILEFLHLLLDERKYIVKKKRVGVV